MNKTTQTLADPNGSTLKAHRMGIDTYQEPVIYMRTDCHVCRSEGFSAQSRVYVQNSKHAIVATLSVVDKELLPTGEAGLSEAAWNALGVEEGTTLHIRHPTPLRSLSHVRAKIYGKELPEESFNEIIQDVATGFYSDVQLSSFITACAMNRLSIAETGHLTKAMVAAGETISWGTHPVMDKHCVGGLPGNRTTLIIVPIVTAHGICMPKTSSRAITSPAGTADTMECLAPVDLELAAMRRVVDQEGGCIVWGGGVRLSPADDVLIRIERALDLDSEGQMVASILSKKAAAGSSHVVVDVPIGPTAKVRNIEAASQLALSLTEVGRSIGLEVSVVPTDGTQPVGRGVGPALEARDALAVLQGRPEAPADLRDRAIELAGRVLEFSGVIERGQGDDLARETLADGRAWKKFVAICEAQGGMREPQTAPYTKEVLATRPGVVTFIDNRRLARVAKLAGAPHDRAAGLELHVRLGEPVEPGERLFTIHAESSGELEYSHSYVDHETDIIGVGD